MDPFSQAALGAVVGQIAGHRRLGYKAAAVGAVAGALPDIDVLFSVGGDFVDQLITHRGITHSLFFAPVVGPLLGWCIWYRERLKTPGLEPERRTTWMLVVTLALLSHPLLDLLTPYGTQLMLPFSDARFAINAMPIIDPVYTLTLFAGLAAAWTVGRRHPQRTVAVATATLVVSSAYLGYGWLQNELTRRAAAEQLAMAGVEVERLDAFPTILQVHLRRVVARTANEHRVGFYSTWTPCDIVWRSEPRVPGEVYAKFLTTRAGRVFQWFAMDWVHYRVERLASGRRLVAGDLRYGFEEDPLRSIFSVSVPIDRTGTVLGPALAGRDLTTDRASGLVAMIERTYAPACRLFNRIHEDVIPPPMGDNAADIDRPGAL
jgi:inner membrane protein